MPRISISTIDYKGNEYWAVSGVFGVVQTDRLKHIPNCYFSRSKRCWLILRSQLSNSEIESLLSDGAISHGKSGEDLLARSLMHIYRSAWRIIAPVTSEIRPDLRIPKSPKYLCMLRLLYSHSLSINQVCNIELCHINWGTSVLEINIPDLQGNKIILDRVTSQLITKYLVMNMPDKYLFESQPGQAFPEEKMYRGLLTIIPDAKYARGIF